MPVNRQSQAIEQFKQGQEQDAPIAPQADRTERGAALRRLPLLDRAHPKTIMRPIGGTMKYASMLLIVTCLLTTVSAQSLGTRAGIDARNRVLFGHPAGSRTYYTGAELPWAERPPKPRLLVYTLEAGGALGGVVVCGGVAALSLIDLSQDLLTASLVGLPFASACGTYLVGRALDEHGTAVGAIIGALVGVPVGLGIVALSVGVYEPYHSQWAVPMWAAAVLAPPVGALIGYNLSIPNPSVGSGLGGRLQLPGVTFASRELPDHSKEYGVRVQLAGVRF